jgi:O-antigen/teichoic acid export membrane protein
MFSYISNIVTLILGFISRTVFINTLGATYLGINGLFLNILNVLSFSELGIGASITFALYKPLADKDISKLKSLMYLYKKAYRVIAIIILVVGIGLVPFLHVLVKGGQGVENLSFIYLIFLFNTVSSYFVTHKITLLIADQKKYITTVIDLCGYICTVIIQIILLKVYKNFIIYLIAGAFMQLVLKIFSNLYINREYPFLKDKNVEKLSKEETDKIKVNVKALIMHKLGEISIYQTDNIIISSFVSVKIVGLISNYSLIINSVWIFIGSIFSSATASLGNLIANDSEEKQYLIFKVYRLISFWLIGFSTIAFYILTEPFITLWIGNNNLIDKVSFALIILNYYLAGDRTAAINMKQAAGNYKDDRYVSLFQGITNLIISMVLVSIVGLPGVYIGTILSSLIPNIVRPYMLYKNTLNKKFSLYIKDSIYYFFSVLVCVVILHFCSAFILTSVNVVRFILLIIIVTVLPNLIFILFYYKTEEFKYVQNILKKIINKIIRRTEAV